MTHTKAPARPIRLLLVRHGETDENVKGIIQGQLDTDLNSFGQLQAHLTGQYLSETRIDEVYASPLKRARDTALLIVKEHKLKQPIIHTDDRLMERYFGSLQGSQRLHNVEPEDAEPIEDVQKRLGLLWNDVLVRPGPWPILQNGSTEDDEEEVGLQRIEPADIRVPDIAKKYSNIPSVSAGQDTEGHMYARSILIVSHGAALKNLIKGVLIPTGQAAPRPNLQEPRRLGNCSVTEIIYPGADTQLEGTVPIFLPKRKTGRECGIITKWSDVSHMPKVVEEQLVANVDESVGDRT